MLPVGPLMIEHRLIERMIAQMNRKVEDMKSKGAADIVFIDMAVDFIRTYADKLHHGKEEDILFRELTSKKISTEHNRIMGELIEEHIFGRKTTAALVDAKERYIRGNKDALKDIIRNLETLATFYPKHIEKEDKHFFIPVMEYFSDVEKEKMTLEFNDFDGSFIHNKYKSVVEALEG
jgi:hemerythrin-like domain-containing protein